MKRSFSLCLCGLAFLFVSPVARAQVVPRSGADAATESEADKLVKTYAFRGSIFSWFQSLSALSLDRSAEQTYNPTYSWLFRIWPRYNFTDKFSLRLKIDIGVELTNSDETTRYRETQLGDTWLDAVYASFRNNWSGIDFIPSLRLIFPTSKVSQARSLYMSISPGFGIRRAFSLPRGMDLDLSYTVRYTKHLNRYTTVQYDAPTIGSCAAGGGDCGQFIHSGARNPSHDFWNILALDWGITSKLRTSVMVAFYNALLYDLTPATATLAGGNTVPVSTGGNDVSHRAAIWYYADVSYQFHPVIGVALGFSTFNPQLAEDSTYRRPFINRFTEIMLSTTVSLDHLVALFDRQKKK